MTGITKVMIEVNEKDQSKVQYLPDWDSVGIHVAGQNIFKDIKLKNNLRIATSSHQCDEKNEQKIGKCISDFLEHKMNCKLPWDHKYSNLTQGKDYCNGDTDFDKYINLTKDFSLSPNIEIELNEFGCLIRNCAKLKWCIASGKDLGAIPNSMLIWSYKISRGTEVT
jgi:hypothetical protein